VPFVQSEPGSSGEQLDMTLRPQNATCTVSLTTHFLDVSLADVRACAEHSLGNVRTSREGEGDDPRNMAGSSSNPLAYKTFPARSLVATTWTEPDGPQTQSRDPEAGNAHVQGGPAACRSDHHQAGADGTWVVGPGGARNIKAMTAHVTSSTHEMACCSHGP
jgi:hypothetical protein